MVSPIPPAGLADTPTSTPATTQDDNPQVALRASVRRDTLHLQLPTRPEMVEPAVMMLKDRAEKSGACSPEQASNLVISLTEAITNAMIHGNLNISSTLKELPGNAFSHALAERTNDPHYATRIVDVLVEDDGERCTWTITDAGAGFDVSAVLAEIDSDEPQLEKLSGRGLLLMRALMNDVAWSYDGRRVSMSLSRGRAARCRTAAGAPDVSPRLSLFDTLPTVRRALTPEMISHAQRLLLEIPGVPEAQLLAGDIQHIAAVSPTQVQILCTLHTGTPLSDAGAGAIKQIERLLTRSKAATVSQVHESRRDLRMIYTQPLCVSILGTGGHTAIARNLSRSGMAFVADIRLPKGQEVELTLEPEGADPFTIRAKIVRSHRIAATFYDFGAEFLPS